MLRRSLLKQDPTRVFDHDADVFAENFHRGYDRADMLWATALRTRGPAKYDILEEREELLSALDPNYVSSSGDPVYDEFRRVLEAGGTGEEAEEAADRVREEMMHRG